MLQINTGKFFTHSTRRTNLLRGVLYTNVSFDRDVVVETVVGKLFPASNMFDSPNAVVYEFVEQLEGEIGSGVIGSHGNEPYLNDMAVIFSFFFQCICTPDIDLFRRLTSGKKVFSTATTPSKLVRRVFEPSIVCSQEYWTCFPLFFKQLIGLERKTYLTVVRAIRTYVTGMHRIADDLDLAYTLMVAAVESLAQQFDGHQPDWLSVDERKRMHIDKALECVSAEVAERVRDAILKGEYTALSRRFREFVCAHVSEEYFQYGFSREDKPIGRSELQEVLAEAYLARSKHIHTLKKLPDYITHGFGYCETIIPLNKRAKMLSFQGLSRLMRHVIIEFINKQPLVEVESYEYELERYGVIQIKIAPMYWIGNVTGDIANEGRDRLENFLHQLSYVLLGEPDAKITDMKAVFEWLEKNVNSMKKKDRLPYLAIYILFNWITGRQDVHEKIDTLVEKEFVNLSSESLLVSSVFNNIQKEWATDQIYDALIEYRRLRSLKSGVRFPKFFEAIIAIQLAEQYRQLNNINRAKEIVIEAADDFPEFDNLRKCAAKLSGQVTLKWEEIMLLKKADNKD